MTEDHCDLKSSFVLKQTIDTETLPLFRSNNSR